MKILITCGNSPIIKDVIRLVELIDRVEEVFLCDSEPIIGLSQYRCLQVPHASEDAYLNRVEQCVQQNEIDFILVGSDLEAFKIAGSSALRCKSHLDTQATVGLVLDKLKLHETIYAGLGRDFCPEFCRLPMLEVESGKTVGEKMIVRPITGRGSRGLKFIDVTTSSGRELLEQSRNSISAKKFFVAEFLPGDKYSVDAVFSSGTIMTAMARDNGPSIKYKPPTMAARACNEKDVFSFAATIGSFLGLDGFHQIECGRSGNGRIKLIEINPRLDATLPMTVCYKENIYSSVLGIEQYGIMTPIKSQYKRFLYGSGF